MPKKRPLPPPARPSTNAAAVKFYDGFRRLVEFLERPQAGTRRDFYGLLLAEALASCACDEGWLLLAGPQGVEEDLQLEAVQGVASEIWAGGRSDASPLIGVEAARSGVVVTGKAAIGHTLGLPLRWNGKALGALVLVDEAAAFDKVRVLNAQHSAENLAAMVSASQGLALKRETEHRLQALTAAGVAVARGRDFADVLTRICRQAEELVQAEGAAVFLLDAADQSLSVGAATGPGAEKLKGLRLEAGEGVAGWVIQQKQPLLIEDAGADPRFSQRADKATHQRTRTLAAVPITADGRVNGVLELVNKVAGGHFRSDEIPLLQALAQLAGVAIENSRLFDALAERARRLNAEVVRANVETTEAKNRLESVLFAMEDAVIAADENGRVTLLNRTAQLLSFGLSHVDAQGRDLHDVLPGLAFAETLKEVRQNGLAATVEIELAVPELRAFAVVLTPIRDLEGYLTGIVVVLRDITRFRELERMKSAFLNTVSHELRTPITSIRAFSEILARKDPAPDKAREWAQVINEESERLNRLIDDLLDVSRIEAGKKLSVVKKPVDLPALVKRSLSLFEKDRATHPLQLGMDEGLSMAELDPDRFEQVLSNLISNAIKYSPAGGAIDVRVRFAPPEGLRVEVQDHGLGLSPTDKAHMFEKFYRAEGEHMKGIRGTGLGLSITKYLIEAHGGQLGLESELGKGSTFWFEVPLFGAKPENA